MARNIRDIDRGWNRIKQDLGKLDRSYTKVGVQAGSIHNGNKKSKGNFDLVQIAAVNEFGSKDGRIPSRPALRQSIDNNQQKIDRAKEAIYDRILSGNIPARRALGLLGEYITALQKKQITKLRTPPNAARTIAKKKSSNPLIDTGQYRNSITHVEVFR